MFYIWDENYVGNTVIFQLLLNRTCTKSKTAAFHITPPLRRLGYTRSCTGRAADPKWPKGCSKSYDITLIVQTRAKADPGPAEPLPGNGLGINWWVVHNCIVHNLFCILIIIVSLHFLSCETIFISNCEVFFLFVPPNFHPTPQEGGRMKAWLCGA